MEQQRKKVLLMVMVVLSGIGGFTQGNGSAGIDDHSFGGTPEGVKQWTEIHFALPYFFIEYITFP